MSFSATCESFFTHSLTFAQKASFKLLLPVNKNQQEQTLKFYDDTQSSVFFAWLGAITNLDHRTEPAMVWWHGGL